MAVENKKWYYGMPAKTGIFLTLILSVLLAVASGIGIGLMWMGGVYTTEKVQQVKDTFYNMAYQETYRISNMVINGHPYNLSYLERSNCSYELKDKEGKKIAGEGIGNMQTPYTYRFAIYEVYEEPYRETYLSISELVPEKDGDYEYELTIYIDDRLLHEDKYALANHVINIGYAMRYWIYPIAAFSLILVVICFVFLMCGAGHHRGSTEVTDSTFSRIPTDLYLAGIFMILLCIVYMFSEMLGIGYYRTFEGLALIIMAVAAMPVFVGCCMNLAVRIKLGTIWKNTLIYRVLVLLRRFLRAAGRVIKIMFAHLPLLWKVVLAVAATAVIESIVMVEYWYNPEEMFLLYAIEKILVFLLLMYVGICLVKLQKGAKALAEGNLNHKIDSKNMHGELREHAGYLNSIGVGMTTAVNERIKSERMKTELITNVSHDIKTPLTSIINYSDLIGKEESENPKITEYAAVLTRQAARLKKLIEDLVEASKASTGNLEVTLSPMEIGVILVQAVGEYTERLKEKELQLITKQPEEPIKIMADGRRLWRVIDNLMNNVCKYAQEGTRVYLTVEKRKGLASITLKNTSKYPLDIPAEELMERFVRGDESRSTDGNGLGLSIAQSLTELQKGRLKLTVDGDLFKVTLEFPVLGELELL